MRQKQSPALSRVAEQFVAHCRYSRSLSENTARAYKQDLRDLLRCLGSRRQADSITRPELEDYVQSLQGVRRLSPATARRRYRTLLLFFAWARSNRLIRRNPVADYRLRVRVPRTLPRTITRSELSELLHVSGRHLRMGTTTERRDALNIYCGILIMASTGVRISELCSITLADIGLETKRIRIHGKGNRERVVYLVGTYRRPGSR